MIQMKNEELEELWKIKDETGNECQYDVARLVKTLRKMASSTETTIVHFSAEPRRQIPSKRKAA